MRFLRTVGASRLRGRDASCAARRSGHWYALASFVILLFVAGVTSSCTDGDEPANEARLLADVQFDPAPPREGVTQFEVRLTRADGRPYRGAELRIEGNMNHAGMVPEFADTTETAPGVYSGKLEFTMGGDWFLLLTVSGPGDESHELRIDVPGVKSE